MSDDMRNATQGGLALYLNEVQPVDGRVQINISIDELTVLRHLAGAAPAVGGEQPTQREMAEAIMWALCRDNSGAGEGKCDPEHCVCGADSRGLLRELNKAGWTLTPLAAPPASHAAVGGEFFAKHHMTPDEAVALMMHWQNRALRAEAALAAAPAVGGEPIAWLVPSDETGFCRIWWRDKDRAEAWLTKHPTCTLISLYAAQPASPLRGRETIANAIREYCRSLTPAAVQNSHGVERIYYAGLSVYGLTDAIASASPPEQPAAYPSAEADEEHADLLRRLATVPKEEKE